MLDPDLFYAAPWGELYRFFASGNPPLVLQLLLLNTAFLIFFIIRRLRRRTAIRSQSTQVVQAVLIAVNATVMFAPPLAPHPGVLLDRLSAHSLPGIN
jgi:sorbitol-specific phosphotransferase system component IIC